MGLFDFCSKLYIDDFYHIVLKDFPILLTCLYNLFLDRYIFLLFLNYSRCLADNQFTRNGLGNETTNQGSESRGRGGFLEMQISHGEGHKSSLSHRH